MQQWHSPVGRLQLLPVGGSGSGLEQYTTQSGGTEGKGRLRRERGKVHL